MSKILIHWIYGYHRDKIKNGYWTSSRVIWSEIIIIIIIIIIIVIINNLKWNVYIIYNYPPKGRWSE